MFPIFVNLQFSYPKTETFVVVAVDFDDELKNNWYYTDQRLKYLKPLKGHHIQHNSKFWPLGQNILVSGILFTDRSLRYIFWSSKIRFLEIYQILFVEYYRRKIHRSDQKLVFQMYLHHVYDVGSMVKLISWSVRSFQIQL